MKTDLVRGLIALVLALTGFARAASPVGKVVVTGFTPIQEVLVVPDGTYRTGAFCRVNHLPARDCLVITFGTGTYGTGPPGYAQGMVYKEYTPGLVHTGAGGYFHYGGGDTACAMVGNTYYLMTGGGGSQHVRKYDAVTWQFEKEYLIPISEPNEITGDQMLAWVNGMLDAGSLYDPNPGDPASQTGTWHCFLTPELEFVEKRTLTDTPHQNGSSMLFVGGVYHLFSSAGFFGDLILLRYDVKWNFLGARVLHPRSNWPQGTLYDPEDDLFYAAHLDTRNPGCLNALLSAFDREGNLLAGVAVTGFSPGDAERRSAGRPSVTMHQGRLYVSYDVDTSTPSGQTNFDWSAWVKTFDPVKYRVGDLNEDGWTDSADAVILSAGLVGGLLPGSAPFTAPAGAADTDRDGDTDAADALSLALWLAGGMK